MSYSLRFLLFAALGLALLGLPQYTQIFVPAACATLTKLGGWLAAYPDAVHGARLQAAPEAYYVEVNAECLGMESLLAFAAAVLAFAVSPQRRISVLLAGVVLMLLLNACRIAGLYHIGLHSLRAAEWAHDWLLYLPFLLLYMALLYVASLRGDISLAAMRQQLDRDELRYWGKALALLAVSMSLWHLYGPSVVALTLRDFTKLLVGELSLGAISDVGSLTPNHLNDSWQFAAPAFFLGADGDTHAAELPFNYIAYLLFPLLSFVLCQLLLGGGAQKRGLLYGSVAGILWYGIGLIIAVVHEQTIAAMGASSPFSPYIDPPAYKLLVPPALPVLFYGSGWLFEVFFTLSKVIGFALWAEWAQGGRAVASARI